MKTNFLENSALGKNEWWRYVLTLLSIILSFIVCNILLRQIQPIIKPLLPHNNFGKDLGTFILIFLVFGTGLTVFIYVASKLHQRTMISFINTVKKFDWKLYLYGFLMWSILLFTSMLLTNFEKFNAFLQTFSAVNFLILFVIGFISIGIQSFFEEIILRGYWLQGLHIRIKNIIVLVLANSLIFALLHFGYGIESFMSSWLFGIAFAVIVVLQNRIEFVSGAHNANNLLLSLVFLDLSEATSEKFSWTINWIDFGLHFIVLLLFTSLVYKFFRK